MTKVFLRVHAPLGADVGFYPSDKHSFEIAERYKHGDIVRAELKRPRHPGHHRKYFAMLGLVHEASNVSDLYPTVQHLHDAIKGALGYWTEIRLPDGKVFKKVDSIAFESMAQDDFEQFYNRAVALICEQIVPNMDRADLEREVLEMTRDR